MLLDLFHKFSEFSIFLQMPPPFFHFQVFRLVSWRLFAVVFAPITPRTRITPRLLSAQKTLRTQIALKTLIIPRTQIVPLEVAEVSSCLRHLLADSSMVEKIGFLAFDQAMEHHVCLMDEDNSDIGNSLIGSD